nr:hypothetical protein [Desulfobacula sp.]
MTFLLPGKILRSFQFYGYALIQILIEPKRFFTELPDNTSMMKSLGFFILCAVFYTGASLLISRYAHPVETAAIFFLGSLGMTFISACVSYGIMTLTVGRRTGFEIIFSIHAFSSGMMLLLSWVSFFFWLTEVWKCWLIYTGFKNAGRLSWKPAILIPLISMGVYIFLALTVVPFFFKP